VLVPVLPKSAADFTVAEWIRFWESPPRHALRQLGVHIPWEKKVVATAEPLQPDAEARRQAEKWVERSVAHGIKPSWEVAALTGFFPPSPEGETLLDILVQAENGAEDLMLAKLREHLSPDKNKSLSEAELVAAELAPFKTDDFRLFVHGNTVGVACLGYFSEDKHPYRWLMNLPAISTQVGRPLHRLFVTGVKPPGPDEVVKAAQDGKGLNIKLQIIYLELPSESLGGFRDGLTKLMDAVVDESAPLMPITFATGVEQRIEGKPAKISDSDLRSSEHGRGDSDDPRARILVPEQFDFPAFAATITSLIPAGARRLTTSRVQNARMTRAEELAAIAAKREADESKELLKQENAKLRADKAAANKAAREQKAREKAEKDAAKAAAAESGEPPAKKAGKSKKKEDLS